MGRLAGTGSSLVASGDSTVPTVAGHIVPAEYARATECQVLSLAQPASQGTEPPIPIPIPIPDLPGIGDHPHPRFPSGVPCPAASEPAPMLDRPGAGSSLEEEGPQGPGVGLQGLKLALRGPSWRSGALRLFWRNA